MIANLVLTFLLPELSKIHARCIAISATKNKKLGFIPSMVFILYTTFFAFSELKLSNAIFVLSFVSPPGSAV